jgi:hypothetical protein
MKGMEKSDKTCRRKCTRIKETASWCLFLLSVMALLRFMGLESRKENCNLAAACLVAGRLMFLLFVLF